MKQEGWRFEKGDERLPTVRRSEVPIKKEDIEDPILEFIYSKMSEGEKRLLEVSDFNLNFLCWGEETAFVEINTTSGNGSKVDLKLSGVDAKKFVKLIDDTRFDENSIRIKT